MCVHTMQSRSSQTHTDTHKHTQSHIQCNPWMHEYRQKHTHLFVICYLGVAVVQEVKSSTDCKVGGLIHGCSSNDPEPQVAPAVFTGVWKCVWYNYYEYIQKPMIFWYPTAHCCSVNEPVERFYVFITYLGVWQVISRCHHGNIP